MLWHRLAPGFHLLAAPGVGGAHGGSGAVRGRSIWFLRLGISHVFQRAESLLAAGFLAAGFVAWSSGERAACQLVGHDLGWRDSSDHGDAVRHRVYFTFSLRRSVGVVPRPS